MKFLLLVVIFLEGYAVLATELLAMRLVLPWVGTGTDVIAIIIAAVLLPLAFGYHYGGMYRRRLRERGLGHHSVRKKLLSNVMRSTLILCIGLSYVLLEIFFSGLYFLGIRQRLMQLTVYCSIFLVYPVFLLGQTIPLIGHYYSRQVLSEMTGRMLFFSTLGSFMGSVFTTVVLMAVIGVHYTSVFIIGVMCVLIFLLARKKQIGHLLTAVGVFILMLYMNSGEQMRSLNIVSNNGYSTVQVRPMIKDPEARLMMLNNNLSSSYKEGEGSAYPYGQYIERFFLDPIAEADPPKRVLVLGAAGFTLGVYDNHNEYIYVDIDPDLQKVAEEHFLKKELEPNKKFVARDARVYVREAAREGRQYDLIILDTFKAGFSMPEHLLTREYFLDVKASMAPGGVMVMNSVAGSQFADKYTRRMDNTLRSVFPHLTRVVMSASEIGWNAWENSRGWRGAYWTNVLYIYNNNPEADADMTIYTDDKNTYFLDK
ncbi:MAG: hypothetical protein EA357_07285 [Micavibrio sp.]|nr:MAG: hypothetical protein EA357_07285 [Micavibrio sp.]